MPFLSLVIITHNEEKNIARCLRSVQGVVDEIVVVDSHSKDATQKICEGFGARVIERNWEGYSETKNFANSKAKYDWILSLDADEALSDELRASILAMKQKETWVRCSFNRLTQYCGKWIHHSGWYPDTKLRIFNRKETEWKGLIHEQLVHTTEAPVHHLKGNCLHYSYYTLQQHLRQTERFTDLSAKDMWMRGVDASWIKIHLSPIVTFLKNYILKLGVLDGHAGFMICKVSALSVRLKYLKLKKMSSE